MMSRDLPRVWDQMEMRLLSLQNMQAEHSDESTERALLLIWCGLKTGDWLKIRLNMIACQKMKMFIYSTSVLSSIALLY